MDKSKNKEELLEDGFGNSWSKVCDICGEKTIQIVRPGKVDCYNFYCGLNEKCNDIIDNIVKN